MGKTLDDVLPALTTPEDALERIRLLNKLMAQNKINYDRGAALVSAAREWTLTYQIKKSMDDRRPDWK